jgi:undecaprenyl-diphosphatase
MTDLIGLRLPSLSEWIEMLGHLYGSFGYPLVLLGAALENTFLITIFFPGGTMVLLGGIYSRTGQLELPYVVLSGWIGTTIGASIDYGLGRWGGSLMRPFLARPDLAAALVRVGAMLRRYGVLALMAGHFFAPLRSLVALSAGMARMEYWRFALYELPAALTWATAYGIGGYLLADQIPLLERILERFGWVFAAATAIVVVWRVRRRPRPREA